MIGTVASLRAYGPGAAFVDLDDVVLEAALIGATKHFESYLLSGGDESITSYDANLERKVYAHATWDLIFNVRGANPADPSHMALTMARDHAQKWLDDVASNKARLANASPARRVTGVASVISTGDGGRGW